MNLIFATKSEQPRLEAEFRNRGCAVESIPLERLIEIIHRPELVAEAIICFADYLADPDETGIWFVEDRYNPGITKATRIESELRLLPDDITMPDGRKWKAVPFLILTSQSEAPGDIYLDRHKGTILRYENVNHAFDLIEAKVREYRQRLLNDLDNLGFLVKVENGRYRVGPALKPRASLESEYYHGLGDRRDHSGAPRLFTVDRDLYGIQYEIEQFEALINKSDVSEGDLQNFFESHPHFLVTAQLMQAIPHVRLEEQGGRLLIPDFVLKPIVAMKRDSKWEVLDLKTPQVKLLAGKKQRFQFSHQVMKAITQLRDYGDYFKNPGNSETVSRILGHQLKHPKLAVLIGRLREDQVEALELAQSRDPDVRIVTYDEILENQKRFYDLKSR